MSKDKKAAPKRKANGYKMPDPLPAGEILQDLFKKQWRLGVSIGKGGFGEIYCAQEMGDKKNGNYPYVIKIEPHTNGPLFVEMHFYTKNAKQVDIDAFKIRKKLTSFGMPAYIGSGSHEFKNEKYRFIVMEKFGTDIWKLFEENKRVFPEPTVYKIALQVLDVLEYIHSKGFVHADIKGANILLGITKNALSQTYLVDFGLAGRFSAEKEFKPNPKKMHDGTIEYLSRDAHYGVQTRRGDMEILAYNMIQWLGCTLPWEKSIKDAKVVQASKEKHMANIPDLLKACFGAKKAPDAIDQFLKYIKSLEWNEEPDYKKIQKIFQTALQKVGGTEKTALIFKTAVAKSPSKRKSGTALENGVEKKAKIVRKKPTKAVLSESGDDEEMVVVEEPKKTGRGRRKVIAKTNGEASTEDDDRSEIEEIITKPTPKRRGRRAITVDTIESIKQPKPTKKPARNKDTLVEEDESTSSGSGDANGVIFTAEMMRIKNRLEAQKISKPARKVVRGTANKPSRLRLNKSLDNAAADSDEEETVHKNVTRRRGTPKAEK